MTTGLGTGPDRGGPPVARKVAANSTAQLVTFAFRAAAGVGVVVLLARDGGPLALGIVQFALTLSGLLPFYYGVPTLLAREVARRPEEGRRWVETGTLLALLLGAAFTVLLPGAALAVGADRAMVVALAVASLGMAFDGVARVQFSAFWAWERMELETQVTAVQETAYVLGTAVVLWQDGGPIGALAVFTASRAVGACGGWLVADGPAVHAVRHQRHVDADLRALRHCPAGPVEGAGAGRSLPGRDEPGPPLQRRRAQHQPGTLPPHGSGVATPAGRVPAAA
jgi:hypothetical protein